MLNNKVGRLDSLRVIMKKPKQKTRYIIEKPEIKKSIYSGGFCNLSDCPLTVVTPDYYTPTTKKGRSRFFKKFVSKSRSALQVASLVAIGLLTYFGAKWASVPTTEEMMIQNQKYNFSNKTNLNQEYYESIPNNDYIKKNNPVIERQNAEKLYNIATSDNIEKQDVKQVKTNKKENSFNNGTYIVKPKDNYWKIAEKYLKENMAKKDYKKLTPEKKETLVGKIWSAICDINIPLETITKKDYFELPADIIPGQEPAIYDNLENVTQKDPYTLYPGDTVKYEDSVLKNIIAKHK